MRNGAKLDGLVLAHVLAVHLERHWPPGTQRELRLVVQAEHVPAIRRMVAHAEHLAQCIQRDYRAHVPQSEQVKACIEAGCRARVDRASAQVSPRGGVRDDAEEHVVGYRLPGTFQGEGGLRRSVTP